MRLQKAIKGLLAVTILTVGMYVGTIGAFAAGTCKVSEGAAKIRATASTSADVVGSTTKGSKLDVLSQTKDSSGYTWYKVKVEGDKTGYIRGDLVTDVEGDIKSENGDTTETTTTVDNTPSEAQSTTVDPCEYSTGITKDAVSVRESTSTNSEKKATTTPGQAVEITGQAKASDGKIWYQVKYGDISGFIRSDLVTVGEDATVVEEETFTEEDDAVSEESWDEVIETESSSQSNGNGEYELKYEANDEGADTWYLYDHVNGTRQSLDNIFAVMKQSQTMQANSGSTSTKMKTIVIIMGVVILILIIAVTILLFKLRDSYEDWEDEDDDEDEEEEDEEDNVTIAKKRTAVVNNKKIDIDDDEELDDEDIKIVTRKGKPKKASSSAKPSRSQEAWKSNSFLEIDDDMEFEFLDIDK